MEFWLDLIRPRSLGTFYPGLTLAIAIPISLLMEEPAETFTDKSLGFTLPERNARARVVRLDGVVDDVLEAHDYPPPVKHLLGEALVLTALMGGLLETAGTNAQLTFQAQAREGVITLLVCDYLNGDLRGYADFDAGTLSELGANPSLSALFGQGYLAITFETGEGQRYQGIVPLESGTLSEACETYFSQSEQIPTLVRTASRSNKEGEMAAGLLIQHLADGEEGRERLHVQMDHPDWQHVAVMAGSVNHEELLDRSLSLESLAWRLFHEEDQIRVQPVVELSRGCRCSPAYYQSVISKFPSEERDSMKNGDGDILVDCAFCSKTFAIEI